MLETWDRIERGGLLEGSAVTSVQTKVSAPVVSVDPTTLPDGAWASGSDSAAAALAQLAALIKALPGPMPIVRVRLAALYALEPRYLTRRLSGTDRTTWRRLVGREAELPAGTNVAAFAPRIDASWQGAVTQLRGMGAIIENLAAQSWAPGARIQEFHTETWPDGRAAFVVRAIAGISLEEATTGLSSEDVEWVRAYAA